MGEEMKKAEALSDEQLETVAGGWTDESKRTYNAPGTYAKSLGYDVSNYDADYLPGICWECGGQLDDSDFRHFHVTCEY